MSAESISDRLKQVIDEKTKGKHTVFSEKAGIPKSTFQYYINGRTPHPDHLIRISETFDVNIHWLLTGKGKKYICDDDSGKPTNTARPIDTDPEINDLLKKTRDVLVSDTSYAESLKANVNSFHESVKAREEIKTMRSEINELKKHMTSDRRKGGDRRFKTDGLYIMDKSKDRRKGKDRRTPGLGE